MPCETCTDNVKEYINHCEVPIHSKAIEAKIFAYQLSNGNHSDNYKVVIDAGHGGHDPGCMGTHSKEKDIALSIALKLGTDLNNNHSEIKVLYTRKKDVFIPLHKRIALANKENADIFISIHCNYVGNPKICGTETYVMGLHRAEDNLKVAKRENSVVLLEEDFKANYEGYDPNSPIGHILLSMFQNLYLDQSILLSSSIEKKFENRKSFKSRGVKQAGFVVLRQATMPSILVETGFLSNPKEESYLISKKGQLEIAKALSSSIATFFKNIERKKKTISKKDKPVDSKLANYTIQLGVFSNEDNKIILNKSYSIGNPKVTKIGPSYRYTIGKFNDRQKALSALKDVKASGIEDAFIKKL